MAIALALFTSVAYGLSNYLGPRLARGAPYLLLLLIGQGCALVLAGAVVAVRAPQAPGGEAVAWALAAGLGNVAGLVLFYRAAAIGPLSLITPIGSLGAALPVAVGLAGGDTLTAGRVAGFVLALTGVVLVARAPRRPPPTVPAGVDAKPVHREADRLRVVALSLLSAIGFGLFLVAMRPAAEDGAPWAVFLSRVSLVAVLAVFAVRSGAFARARDHHAGLLAIPGVLLFAGTLAYAAATRRGDLSVVSVVGSLFPVVTVALAVTLDRERLTALGATGVTAAIAGVVLLSAA